MQDDLSVREPGVDSIASSGGGFSEGQPQGLSPEDDFARVEHCCRAADHDERRRCWDPNAHPKTPDAKEEGVTSLDGSSLVDVQRDSPLVDDVADYDLGDDELLDVDL